MSPGILSWVFRASWGFVCLGFVEFWEINLHEKGVAPLDSPAMPQFGDKRFVQTSHAQGVEVMLLRKSNEAGFWLVLRPDQRILRLKLIDRQWVRTPAQGGKGGVWYQPLPVLSTMLRNRS